MDTSRLPAYRFSYLLRFHPYPRAKPSVRERIAVRFLYHAFCRQVRLTQIRVDQASAREHEYLQMDILRLVSF